MKFSFVSLITKLTLATSVASTLVGCGEPELPTPVPVTESSVGQAQVLVVNAAPGATGTSITLDNVAFGSALPYLGVSAATSVAAGLRLFIYNEPTSIPATPVVTPTPNPPLPVVTVARPVVSRAAFLGGTNYTVFITDVPTRAYIFPITATSDQGGIRLLTLTDNLAPPAVATNAKIRFVNLAPTATSGSTTYGIFNSLTQASLFSAIPTRRFRDITFTTAAVPPSTTATITAFANFTEVAAGPYTLDVRSAATTPLVNTQQVITLVAGKSYTLYTRGIAGSTTTPLGISVVTHN